MRGGLAFRCKDLLNACWPCSLLQGLTELRGGLAFRYKGLLDVLVALKRKETSDNVKV